LVLYASRDVSRVDWAEALTTSRTTVLAVLVPRGSQRKHSHRAGQGRAGQGRAEQKIKNQKKKLMGMGWLPTWVTSPHLRPRRAAHPPTRSTRQGKARRPACICDSLTHAPCARMAHGTRTHTTSPISIATPSPAQLIDVRRAQAAASSLHLASFANHGPCNVSKRTRCVPVRCRYGRVLKTKGGKKIDKLF
jgi:hypothetical protein